MEWLEGLMYKPTKTKTKRGYMTESTNPGQLLVHRLHLRIEEISTLLAGSTRVSRRVTHQGGLTQLDYYFHVNAHKHFTTKQSKATQGRVKRSLVSIGNLTLLFFYMGLNSIRADKLSAIVSRILNKKKLSFLFLRL